MNDPTRRPGNRLSTWPLYPFLVGALPAVHFYEDNFRLLQGSDLVRPIILAFVLVAVLLVAGRFVWRSSSATAVVLTPLLIVLFKGADVGGWLSGVLLAGTLILGVVLRWHPPAWAEKMSLPLNATLAILLVLPLINVWRAAGPENAPIPSAFFKTEVPVAAPPAKDDLPDIYYLMVDGLGQPAFVETSFPVPAEKYSRLFSNRGFQVLRHSFANYPQTALSTAATFNLAQMDHVLDIPDPANRDRRVLEQVAGDSRAVRTLQKLGYQVVSYPSGYPLTRQARADHRHEPFLNPSFLEYYLLEDGVLPLLLPLLGKGPADVSYALRRGRLDFIFDRLPEAREGVADQDPVFVYAHILAPHPPFVFGRQGEALRSRAKFGFGDGDHWLNIHGRDDHSYRQRYGDQAVWVMARLAAAVDGIIASSARPKVIIIQGDHGPGSGLKWERPLETDHNERFGIFNAWYASDGRTLPLYEGMTALNTFPVLFNAYMGTHLPSLPDKHWFARMSEPYIYFPVEK
ncbi:MAG: hypothetical protein QNL91_11860 [Candidatus Krumholzibacteria bacterium]|nr:hypothetical protein [Candidatus Krumholzibacteria bacterium]